MRYQNSIYAKILLATMSAATLFLFSGCTTLDGRQNLNKAPIIWFANVPPEDQSFSSNPVINWIGLDDDGQVVSYRYAIMRVIDMETLTGLTAPFSDAQVEDFIQTTLLNMDDTVWTYLEVDAGAGEPRTSNVIPLKADLGDPVRTMVSQYLFVQGFDEQGASSEIIFRLFRRNDNPPDTRIVAFDALDTKINSVVPVSSATGIRVRWTGSDRIDFPSDPPPFEYEWRLYGPYNDDTTGTRPTDYERVKSFIKKVFVSNDARVFVFGEGEILPVCREEIDGSGNLIEVCDTVLIDTIAGNSALGAVDTLFMVEDPGFVGDPTLNRVAVQSFDGADNWVSNTRDSLYNVFADEPSSSTITRKFIFWVRTRDDAEVPDLTPAFIGFNVVDPKYERNIGIIDAQKAFGVNARKLAPAKAYWAAALPAWNPNSGYDETIDYWRVSQAAGNVLPLEVMLSHKALIVITDDSQKGVLEPIFGKLGKVITSGVNIWLAARSPIAGGEAAPPLCNLAVPPEYFAFFGVQDLIYTGWDWWDRRQYITGETPYRVEDFNGAISLNPSLWPELSIDTAKLHANYQWQALLPWVDSLGALPEVGWMTRTSATEAMYLYKSIYGRQHFLGLQPVGNCIDGALMDFRFQGRPVMIRLNRGIFRTVHSLFTPYAFEETSMQQLVNNVMDFLMPTLASGPSSPRERLAGATADYETQRDMNEYWEYRAAQEATLPSIRYGITPSNDD